MGSMQEIVWYTSTEPAKPYNPTITHTPSRTLDQNTTKRTTSWQAIRLAKSIRKHPSGTESALLGMKSWNNPKATDTWPCVVATWEQSHVSLMATLGLLLHGTQQKRIPPALLLWCPGNPKNTTRPPRSHHRQWRRRLPLPLVTGVMTPDPLPLFFLISSTMSLFWNY